MADATTSAPDFYAEWLSRGNVGTFSDMLGVVFAVSPSAYVNNGGTQTVAQLMTNYPAAVGYNNMYARVSDLYGSVDDIMRCRFDGTNYRWVPQRESYNGTTAATSGTVTITPLVTPPTLRATGTLLGNIAFSPSATNAYVGQRQRVVMAGTLGIFTSTLTGLIGSNITILGGTSRVIEYASSGWFSAD